MVLFQGRECKNVRADDQHRCSNISVTHMQMVSNKHNIRNPSDGTDSFDNCMLFTGIDIFWKACYSTTPSLFSADSYQEQ